ncbi:MAG: RsmF rRNA methyltransferase first C-terminal domain-containing protein [Trueperaceae bacterium]|nr:RsmF rRNA methyltransferase first C-terminal domain-containing protein [Trueperaceae bacterium]
MQLPPGFETKMETLLGNKEAGKLFEALAQEPRSGLRVNTLKLNANEFRAMSPFELSDLAWTKEGFLLESEARAGKHPYHEAGLYYLQEPSAMAVAEVLNPQAGDLVVDLAAAPGGKSTHLSSLMQDSGLLISNEVNRKRAAALLENLERWGSQQSAITSSDISVLAKAWEGLFDKVLLDAPCSGEGMFRKSDDALSMWSETTVTTCALRQDDLLQDAAKLVKPEGHLAYSTCTFAPEENEMVIDKFLSSQPAFELEPISLSGLSPAEPTWSESRNPELSLCRRLWPQRQIGEGHFIALLKKHDGPERKRKPLEYKPVEKRSLDLWQDFARGTVLEPLGQNKQLTVFDKRLFALPDTLPEAKGIHILRAGLFLGWLEKNRFEPAHALALSLTKAQASQFNHLDLELEDPRLEAYLKGEQIYAKGEKGWLLICVAGYPLGWGKRSGENINNARPKGLRWL